jgi:hypothetical protein
LSNKTLTQQTTTTATIPINFSRRNITKRKTLLH